VRQEQLQERLGERFRELDVPLLVEWPDGSSSIWISSTSMRRWTRMNASSTAGGTRFAERFMEKGREEGLEQGLKKGIRQGEAQMLLRQLSLRFGDLPQSAWNKWSPQMPTRCCVGRNVSLRDDAGRGVPISACGSGCSQPQRRVAPSDG